MNTELHWYNTLLSGMRQASQHQQTVLSLPFDLAREHYSKAVRAGLVEKSLIASARFERTLSALEICTLGPWAR